MGSIEPMLLYGRLINFSKSRSGRLYKAPQFMVPWGQVEAPTERREYE